MNFFKPPKTDHTDWHLQRQYIVLRALVPKNNEKTPLAAENFFAALHGIHQVSLEHQETLSFEIAAVNGFVQFFITVPEHLYTFVEGQLYAQYPTVELEKIEDYTTGLQDSDGLLSTELHLQKDWVYPIKTFLNFDVDPLASLTGVLSQASGQEYIIVQFMIRPVDDNWQTQAINYVKKIKAGETPNLSFGDIMKRHLKSATVGVIRGLMTSPTTNTTPVSQEPPKLSAPVEAALKGVEEKITKLGFETLVRIAVASPDETMAQRKLQSVVGAFKQFNTNNMNGFVGSEIVKGADAYRDIQRRYFDKGYILNIEELASVFHLPNVSVETPRLTWAGSKKGEPPSNLPLGTDEEDTTRFAKTNFRGHYEEFGIKQIDRNLHMYAIGKTGTGKSTMLENMIIDDIRKGRGVAVVDPHGDLIKKVIDYIPKERIDDVVLFSPADKEFPIAFNILENVDPDLKNIVASGVVGIFKKIFGESWGPRLEYILRNTVLALLDYPNATMLGILRVLNDVSFRLKVIEQIQDPVIKDFFINEYEKYDQKFRSEAIAPIQNKVGQFLSSSTIRNIVGQAKSSFSIEDIMNSGKILLLDLSIGRIGEDNSALLGSMMITKIQLAAMSRANLLPEQRKNFYLYVDEFQNFATDSFAVILSEARKYKLNLIMTNQYIAQMPELVASAVFGNIGTLISFRVGAGDATVLEQEVAPVFTANDMVNLDNYHIYIKMAINGVTSTPFSARTLPPASEPVNLSEDIYEQSRKKFTRPRAEVEAEIAEIAQYNETFTQAQDFYKTQTQKIDKAKSVVSGGAGESYKKVLDVNNERWFYKTLNGDK